MAEGKKQKNKFIDTLFSNLSIRQEKTIQSKTPKPAVQKPVLKLVFFILDWQEAEKITALLDEEHVRMHFLSKGRGTVRSDVLDLLGVGTSDKVVAICLEQEILVPVLLKEAQKKFGLHNPGAGIAFTVPLTGINSPILRSYKPSIQKNEKIAKHRREDMENEKTYELIIAIINHGYSDEFMDTARAAGATGGTIINARGQAHEGIVKFFGISVQDEKELIIILTTKEKKIPIMRALSEAHGLNSEAHGIVLSVPVDDVLGVN